MRQNKNIILTYLYSSSAWRNRQFRPIHGKAQRRKDRAETGHDHQQRYGFGVCTSPLSWSQLAVCREVASHFRF